MLLLKKRIGKIAVWTAEQAGWLNFVDERIVNGFLSPIARRKRAPFSEKYVFLFEFFRHVLPLALGLIIVGFIVKAITHVISDSTGAAHMKIAMTFDKLADLVLFLATVGATGSLLVRQVLNRFSEKPAEKERNSSINLKKPESRDSENRPKKKSKESAGKSQRSNRK